MSCVVIFFFFCFFPYYFYCRWTKAKLRLEKRYCQIFKKIETKMCLSYLYFLKSAPPVFGIWWILVLGIHDVVFPCAQLNELKIRIFLESLLPTFWILYHVFNSFLHYQQLRVPITIDQLLIGCNVQVSNLKGMEVTIW